MYGRTCVTLHHHHKGRTAAIFGHTTTHSKTLKESEGKKEHERKRERIEK